MIDKEPIKFFLDGDAEKYDELLKILKQIDLEFTVEEQLITENQSLFKVHKNKIIYYNQIPEQ